MLRKTISNFSVTAGQYELQDCKIPFSLLSALIGKGEIEDPTRGSNVLSVGSAVPDSATFRAVISISEAELGHRHAYLRIWGILAECEIYFNGKSYGIANTPDRVYAFDVADRLHAGDNELVLEVVGVIPEKRILGADGERSHEYATAPYLPDMGIIGGCELINTSGAMITDVRVTEAHSEGLVTLMINVDTVGEMADMRAIATLRSPTGQIFYSGISMGNCVMQIKNPELWWPNGLGQPNLYNLTVTLYRGGEATDTYERKIGLREISIGKDANGVPAVVVNGHKIFSRGATYVRECMVLPNYSEKRTEALLRAVRDANMNTLCVISEGLAPSDRFFELCDAYGILVWQDISVHYIHPPIQGAFAAGITAGLRDTISRVTAHPSVALLYLSVTAMAGADEPNGRAELAEFAEIAARILRPVLERYGSSVCFVPDISELTRYDERSITRAVLGDAFADLPTCPAMPTVASFVQEDERNILSPTMELHATMPGTAKNMLIATAEYMRMPWTLEHMHYASCLAAARVVSAAVSRLRAEGTESMSAVCRQLNDSWPAVSPSMIDHYGRKKAIMYAAEQYAAPVTVSATPCRGAVTFYVINERRKPFAGRLTYAIYTACGECLFETKREISLTQMSVTSPIYEDFTRYTEGREQSVYVMWQLADAHGIVCRGTETFVPLKHFAFCNAELTAEVNGMGKSFTVKLSSTAYAAGVCLSLEGMNAAFSRNYFDHSGTEPMLIGVETAEVTTPATVSKRLRITTAADVGKQGSV